MPTHPSHSDPDGDPDGTTRTRMPEDTSAAHRPPARPGRPGPLVTVVGVVVLLIAALAFATRGTGGGSGGTDARNGQTPDTSATAPTGQRPVSGSLDGVPSGFADTSQGAQSAAANYAVTLVSADMLHPAQRHQIVARLFTPAAANTLQQKLDAAYSTAFLTKLGLDSYGNAPQGQTYVSRTVPVGTTAAAFTQGSAATIRVWCTGLYGTAGVGSTRPVTSDWFTITVSLRWTAGDWRIDNFSQQSGPAPIAGDNTASSAEDITKAVEQYGGFTYAR